MANTLETVKTHPIQIPFEGFYNSYIDSAIDDYILNLFDREGTGDTDLIPDEFHHHFTMTEPMQNAICEQYAELFKDWLKQEFEIDISLEYDECTSPKYYNYGTDKIYCRINSYDIAKLAAMTKDSYLEEVIKERHTSYDGFVSFYSNDLETWKEKNPLEYDENELMTLLIAACLSQMDADKCGLLTTDWKHFKDHYEPYAPFFWESALGNGALEVVFEHMPKECQYIANAAYEEREKVIA